MAQVVQAICPGCRSTLRIPSEYLGQPIRCKSCNTVIQARASAPATTVSDTTPVPNNVSNARVAPPNLPTPKSSTKKAPPAAPNKKATPPSLPGQPPASPPPAALATPVQPTNKARNAFAFEDSQPDFSPEEPPVRKRRKKGSSWLPLAIVGVLCIAMGVGVYMVWPSLKMAMQGKSMATAPAEDEGSGKGTTPGDKGATVVDKNTKGTPTGSGGLFPRRAMIISIHNYLYANPIRDNDHGKTGMGRLINSMAGSLRIPMQQIVHLSDANKTTPRPPLKTIIEEGLTNFLKTTRPQDRIVVVFLGHSKEIDGKAYLMPLDGEFDQVNTLIPLDWVYSKLAECKARQKIFVLDGNRTNSAQGEERPASGPMGEKFAADLKAPPAGVEVVAACSAGEQAFEFEETSLGMFLDSFRQALAPEKKERGALDGTIQKPDDLIPVAAIVDVMKRKMEEKAEKRKIKQTPIVAGAAPQSGAAYDASEALAAIPAMPVLKGTDVALVKKIIDDIAVPALKNNSEDSMSVSFTSLPPFPEARVKTFIGSELPPESKLRQVMHEARVALWACATSKPPDDIAADVAAFKTRLGSDLSIMKENYVKPSAADEAGFKNRIFEDSKAMARIIARLEPIREKMGDLVKEMEEGAADKEKEKDEEGKEKKEEIPERWKANFLFLHARFLAQLAYLEAYQGLLGDMRKEFPPHDPAVHDGFKMAAKDKPSDGVGKKYEKDARKMLETLIKMTKDTPWEVLAKREKLTALGLEWQPY